MTGRSQEEEEEDAKPDLEEEEEEEAAQLEEEEEDMLLQTESVIDYFIGVGLLLLFFCQVDRLFVLDWRRAKITWTSER